MVQPGARSRGLLPSLRQTWASAPEPRLPAGPCLPAEACTSVNLGGGWKRQRGHLVEPRGALGLPISFSCTGRERVTLPQGRKEALCAW